MELSGRLRASVYLRPFVWCSPPRGWVVLFTRAFCVSALIFKSLCAPQAAFLGHRVLPPRLHMMRGFLDRDANRATDTQTWMWVPDLITFCASMAFPLRRLACCESQVSVAGCRMPPKASGWDDDDDDNVPLAAIIKVSNVLVLFARQKSPACGSERVS